LSSLALAAAVLAFSGCADFHRGPAPLDGGDQGRADAADALIVDLVFETSVYPILQLHCEDCHMVGREGAYTSLVLTGNARLDRAMIVALVTPGNPTDSRLLRSATGEWHTGGQRFAVDSPQYQSISDWILGLGP
jgi:hypothetical protein